MAGRLQAELKQKVPFRDREQEAYLSLLRTADILQSQVEAKLKDFGLTGTQYNALRILRGAGKEGLPCSEIAERMITRDPDVTRLLNRLEKRGLTTRVHDKRDRRVIHGKITAAALLAMLLSQFTGRSRAGRGTCRTGWRRECPWSRTRR